MVPSGGGASARELDRHREHAAAAVEAARARCAVHLAWSHEIIERRILPSNLTITSPICVACLSGRRASQISPPGSAPVRSGSSRRGAAAPTPAAGKRQPAAQHPAALVRSVTARAMLLGMAADAAADHADGGVDADHRRGAERARRSCRD